MTVLKRISPALVLLVVAPLMAEFLLGDFTVRQLWLLIVFVPMYGGGALLIREIARRSGRGWPSILLLSLAYALIEEGLANQSLFNPNFAGARLLDYGYIPALGTSLHWSVFVLSIHVVWSIGTPILIAEGMASERRTTPWLKRRGLGVAAVLYFLGCAMTARYGWSMNAFRASGGQLLSVGILALAAIVAVFGPGALRRKGRATVPRSAPSPESATVPAPWIVAAICLTLSSAFQALRLEPVRRMLPSTVGVLAMLALEALAVVLIVTWARRERWSAMHYLAIATGTVLTYSWLGLGVFLTGHTNVGASTDALDVIGQIIEVLVVLGLIVHAKRVRRAP